MSTMTVADYERANGFREELLVIRSMGLSVTHLQEAIPARPHRPQELDALSRLEVALNTLRTEIVRTRNGPDATVVEGA